MLFSVGLLIGLLIGLWSLKSYKNLLVMKAEDKTAEYINGKFYYIVEENKQC